MGSKKIRYLFLSLLVIILGVVGFTQLHDQKITPDTADIKVMQSQTEENITSKDQEEPNSKKEETKNEKEDKEISEDSKKQDEDSEKEMRSKVEETVSTDLNQEKTNKKVAKSNLQNSQSKSKQTIKNENPKQSEQIDNKESTKKEPKSSTKKKDTSKKTTEETEKPEKEESQKEDPKGQTVGVLITDGRTNNILPKVQIPYEKGNTALDVTIKALQKAGLQYSIRGTGAGAYVEGINNLYELDGGPLSGWHIRVDGNLIDRSSGVYPVEPGQTVHWNYTYNYLEDTENW